MGADAASLHCRSRREPDEARVRPLLRQARRPDPRLEHRSKDDRHSSALCGPLVLVAVTGAAGFLGSHVADVLTEQGHDVTVIDLVQRPGFRTAIADLGDAASIERALVGHEAVCHLAAIGDVYLAEREPALAAKVNVTGTANLCEAALRVGTTSVIYASTWEVYGPPRYQPIDEAHPTSPTHPYGVTKLAA